MATAESWGNCPMESRDSNSGEVQMKKRLRLDSIPISNGKGLVKYQRADSNLPLWGYEETYGISLWNRDGLVGILRAATIRAYLKRKDGNREGLK